MNIGKIKALADINRLMIVDMLSCGELCACNILEKFSITQSTLSHHMKILCDCGLVSARKEGKWMYYTLDEDTVRVFREFLYVITSDKDECICKETGCDCGYC
jgi:ArsR family transcriptional regulator